MWDTVAHGWNAGKHYRVGEDIMFSSAVVISVHCWVLREHVECFFSDDDLRIKVTDVFLR